MKRVINFAAGPAMIPIEVLYEVQNDLIDYKGLGLSVMEMSHRSVDYENIICDARETLREIMNVPDDYEILFLQGGASLQFSMIPINLATENDITYYSITGEFAKKSYEEGIKCSDARIIGDSTDSKYSYIPKIDKNVLDKRAKYIHITINNTIYGTMYDELPDVGDIPLVGDMSSIILGKNYDVKNFSLIYAGAQKNLGPAGVTLVIIKKDIINENFDKKIPTMLKYNVHAEKESMYNTPPTFGIYIMGLVFHWVKKMGGISTLESINKEKAKMLYDYIDNSNFYHNDRNVNNRSIMNVVWTLSNEELTNKFVEEARKRDLINIKGHRAYGGIRASIYNAMTKENVNVLIDFMKKFEMENR